MAQKTPSGQERAAASKPGESLGSQPPAPAQDLAQRTSAGPLRIIINARASSGKWLQEVRAMKQIPAVGEHLQLEWQGEFFKVHNVFHLAFASADVDAEVWAYGVGDRAMMDELKNVNAEGV